MEQNSAGQQSFAGLSLGDCVYILVLLLTYIYIVAIHKAAVCYVLLTNNTLL